VEQDYIIGTSEVQLIQWRLALCSLMVLFPKVE